MNYSRLDIGYILSNIFIVTVFLSDFGVVVSGQPIYFFQFLAFGFLIASFIYKPRLETGWFLFFIGVMACTVANIGLIFESRTFAGDAFPWTSIKSVLSIILFYAVFKTTLYSYGRLNINVFLFLCFFMAIYGVAELLITSNSIGKSVLQIFHTNPKALDKGSLSLLGREHSYGALGYMLGACILGHYYLTRPVTGLARQVCLLLMPCLAFFAIMAKSKSVFIGILFLVLLLGFLAAKQRRATLSGLTTLFFSCVLALSVSLIAIQNNFVNDIAETLSGDVGSGSTFIRFNFLYVAIMQGLDNLIFGVGPGNYKLYFVEYVFDLGLPIILELKTLTDPSLDRGSVDPTNFFAGIFAEFGLVVFFGVFFSIFHRIRFLIKRWDRSFHTIPLSLLMSPVVFGAALGFYYWSVSFFAFFLAVLHIEYFRFRETK